MLSIGKIAAGPAAARYYTDQVARGREDYYAGEGEEPGTWVGAGAGAAGLSGDVETDRFADLLAGAGLRRPVREGAIAGFDLTFRAPKSVSVLWGIAPPAIARELRAGHDAAVGEALGYLERNACRARRGAGGQVQVEGRGFVAAAFVHRASREGDPLLHAHVVAGNLTQGPDGRWTALDARHLYRQAKTAGYLYQAVLRRELTERLGLQWQPVERGVADVDGVTRRVVEHFSRRRAQILEHMADHGGRSAASAQVAALETRRVKCEATVDRLREVWRSRAAEHGLDARAIDRLLDRDRRLSLALPVDPEALTGTASTFGRAELLQALAEAQPTGARVDELERLADATLADPEIVQLRDGSAPAGVSEPRFTTEEMLRIERELLDRAEARREAGAGVVDSQTTEEAIRERSLSSEQRTVVRRLAGAGEGVAVLRAAAGTGKTFALDAAREAWERGGHDVVGCALSARAALELEDQSGIESLTIASLRRRLERGEQLPYEGVLVVDEAGMVGTRSLAELAEAVDHANGKLVLVGDDRQLPEIEAGGAFHALAERPEACELREVRRQSEGWDRDALDALRRGEVERWARAYRDQGRITVARSAPAARAALVNDWSRAEGDALMIAGRRDDVSDLNRRARELLQAQGRLGPDELDVAGRGYSRGDRVVARRNDRERGILNGQRGTVRDVDRDRRMLEVELDRGKRVTLDAAYLDHGQLDHGYAITAHRAQGATVDRAFVLGSEELYREWGYTALSRHRDEARFYLSRGDLDLDHDRDLAPEPDPVASGLERLMGRSRAKELATDGLADLDTEDLRRERGELNEALAQDPPPAPRAAEGKARELDRSEEAHRAAREREDALREQRAATRWFHRADRKQLDQFLDRNARIQESLETRRAQARAEHDRAGATQQDWIAKHGPEAERYLTVSRELDIRDAAERDAAAVIEHVERGPEQLDPARELPEPETNLDLDDAWPLGAEMEPAPPPIEPVVEIPAPDVDLDLDFGP